MTAGDKWGSLERLRAGAGLKIGTIVPGFSLTEAEVDDAEGTGTYRMLLAILAEEPLAVQCIPGAIEGAVVWQYQLEEQITDGTEDIDEDLVAEAKRCRSSLYSFLMSVNLLDVEEVLVDIYTLACHRAEEKFGAFLEALFAECGWEVRARSGRPFAVPSVEELRPVGWGGVREK